MTAEECYQKATLENLSDSTGTRMDIVYAAMIAFAKYHCEEQLKSIAKVLCDNAFEVAFNNGKYELPQVAIRTAYDLHNIK